MAQLMNCQIGREGQDYGRVMSHKSFAGYDLHLMPRWWHRDCSRSLSPRQSCQRCASPHSRLGLRWPIQTHAFHPLKSVPSSQKGTTEMATATKKHSKVRLQPMGERIVVQRQESEETTAGGIVLPDSAREKPARGTVVAVGSGKLLDDGTRAASQLQEGDMVLFSSYAGETVEIDDVEYLLMREDDVLAVLG